MFIPLYTGEVIDILGSHYQWDNFRSAIILMGLFSLGRYCRIWVLYYNSNKSPFKCLIEHCFFVILSSFSAGCRGGLFMCAINSFTCRIKVQLFGSLVRQDIGFFETIKTGRSSMIAGTVVICVIPFLYGLIVIIPLNLSCRWYYI